MAKFKLETNLPENDKTVEAETYQLASGYFWFRDDRGEDVLTVLASDVLTIERVTES
ncbi:hypothetical protein [Microbacterium sp. NPDC097977]|uniref:hypothetical protein n=1 Tax=Microbacterium sp. NPDC097977 TaxID=3155686 RepID=UPI00332F2177